MPARLPDTCLVRAARRLFGVLAAFAGLTIAVAGVGTAPAHAQSAAAPVRARIDAACGSGAFNRVLSLEKKVDEDANLIDFAAVVSDARGIIRLATPCMDKVPDCFHIATPCDDEPWAFLQDALLCADQHLRYAMAEQNQLDASQAALQREVLDALALCNSHNIMRDTTTYKLARFDIKGTLHIAARYAAYSNTPIDDYLGDLRLCASRIGSTLQ